MFARSFADIRLARLRVRSDGRGHPANNADNRHSRLQQRGWRAAWSDRQSEGADPAIEGCLAHVHAIGRARKPESHADATDACCRCRLPLPYPSGALRGTQSRAEGSRIVACLGMGLRPLWVARARVPGWVCTHALEGWLRDSRSRVRVCASASTHTLERPQKDDGRSRAHMGACVPGHARALEAVPVRAPRLHDGAPDPPGDCALDDRVHFRATDGVPSIGGSRSPRARGRVHLSTCRRRLTRWGSLRPSGSRRQGGLGASRVGCVRGSARTCTHSRIGAVSRTGRRLSRGPGRRLHVGIGIVVEIVHCTNECTFSAHRN
jgi:hypothetical protein